MECESSAHKLQVGVLAIIGSFAEHVNVTKRAATALREACVVDAEVEVSVIRRPDEVIDSLDALIIPGGESTVLSRFLNIDNFIDVVKEWTRKPTKFTWGTCAGLIALSNKVKSSGNSTTPLIGGIDITCLRNGYGRQKESHVTELEVLNKNILDPLQKGLGQHTESQDKFLGVFIRAPVIQSIDSKGVAILCQKQMLHSEGEELRQGEMSYPVGVIQGNKMATTFHPELTDDVRWHAFFLNEALKRKYKK